MTVGRNDPCPCGSGKKFKQCCLGKPPPELRRRRALVPSIIVVAGLALGVYLGMARGLGIGVAAGAAGIIMAGVILAFRDPPPPSGKGSDSAAINFGK